MFNTHGVIAGGAIQVICLLAIIFISIIKPWGRRDLRQRYVPLNKLQAAPKTTAELLGVAVG
jgi:hypothetical protein